jgi:hypothetical protein
MGKVHRPQFEQLIHELKREKALGPKEVAAYRESIVNLIDGIPDLLVNKASITGHPEMRLDIKCSWLSPDWNQADISEVLQREFPGPIFPEDTEESQLIEYEEEVVVLRFAVRLKMGYLAGRIRVLPS